MWLDRWLPSLGANAGLSWLTDGRFWIARENAWSVIDRDAAHMIMSDLYAQRSGGDPAGPDAGFAFNARNGDGAQGFTSPVDWPADLSDLFDFEDVIDDVTAGAAAIAPAGAPDLAGEAFTLSAAADDVIDFDGGMPLLRIMASLEPRNGQYAGQAQVSEEGSPTVHGALSAESLGSDLATLLDGMLDLDGRALVVANDGELAGSVFLVVDANGRPGFQPEEDLVFQVGDVLPDLGDPGAIFL